MLGALMPAMVPPASVLKKVVALVMVASISALPQSNFCSMALVSLFAQQTMKPLMVRVGVLRWAILVRQFRILPLMVKVAFAEKNHHLIY